MSAPNGLGAAQAAARIRDGSLTAERLVRACLDRIAARDPDIRAWSWIDPADALRQARELDKGPISGPLHGIPIGVKDVFDTADMPTQHNSPIFAGNHRPAQDAAAVATLRAAGALILGKTDTTEFAAAGRAGRRPQPDTISTRTPGGSLRRLGRGGRRRPGAARAGHADRRLDHPPRLVLRHLCPEADLGRGQPRGR